MLLALVACGGRRDETPAPQPTAAAPSINLFENGGFEGGRDPWFSLASPERPYWADFSVTDARAHEGRHSAVMQLTTEGYSAATRVYGLLREFRGGPMPARVSGYYRVEDWERGADMQYVQVVVAIAGGSELPEPEVPKQLAYVLGGITEDPFPIRNRRFFFVGDRAPVQNEWVPFQLDIRDDFAEVWGMVPESYETLRVFFEVRFDGREADDPPGRATVYFDDLYLGDGPSR